MHTGVVTGDLRWHSGKQLTAPRGGGESDVFADDVQFDRSFAGIESEISLTVGCIWPVTKETITR